MSSEVSSRKETTFHHEKLAERVSNGSEVVGTTSGFDMKSAPEMDLVENCEDQRGRSGSFPCVRFTCALVNGPADT